MSTLLPPRAGMSRPDPPTRPVRGRGELALLLALYLGYSLSRLGADESFAPAAERAAELLRLERQTGLDLETALNGLFQSVAPLALAGSLYYAAAHYLVTAAVLLWLFRARPASYPAARSVLVLATVVALVLYLLVPLAPPRLVPGYHDVLAGTADLGWWGAEASAPQGLGALTNQLAAFPSMHAGWALWVAWALHRTSTSHRVRTFGWTHALVTAIVVVGTGNHWVLDVVAGWLLVALATAWAWVRRRHPSRRGPARPSP